MLVINQVSPSIRDNILPQWDITIELSAAGYSDFLYRDQMAHDGVVQGSNVLTTVLDS